MSVITAVVLIAIPTIIGFYLLAWLHRSQDRRDHRHRRHRPRGGRHHPCRSFIHHSWLMKRQFHPHIDSWSRSLPCCMLMPVTRASKDKLIQLLETQIAATNGAIPPDLTEWKAQSGVVLRAAVGDDSDLVRKFEKVRYDYHGPWVTGMANPNADGSYTRKGVRSAVALLKAAITNLELGGGTQDVITIDLTARTEIFIVHGHDDGLKEKVARFLLQLTGNEPVILHEQVNAGDTIIEKLERFAATAAYAVVLATADDVGRSITTPDELPRARQNVIFELGYFFAALGRSRVVLIYEPGVERPSDTDGILHIPVDQAGAWKVQLTREIEAAGFTQVDRTALR